MLYAYTISAHQCQVSCWILAGTQGSFVPLAQIQDQSCDQPVKVLLKGISAIECMKNLCITILLYFSGLKN